jgi:AraC-like DNA-binding protein/mannose-6-phosphate isomerase-like protein (cupin superfamily)
MNSIELDRLLRKETVQEKEQIISGYTVNDLNVPFDNYIIPKVSREILFRNREISVRKHPRYAPVSDHTHDFVELNYVYSGEVNQKIGEKEIHLNQGELLVIDKDTPHSIGITGKNDIVINIMIKAEDIVTKIMNQLTFNKTFVTRFMLIAANKNENHDQYIILKDINNDRVKHLFQNMFMIAFSEEKKEHILLYSYLSLIIQEISMIIDSRKLKDALKKVDEEVYLIINYIDKQYKTINLDRLAANFGYNPNYLSRRIKELTGLSFKQLILQKRLSVAKELLMNSSLPIEEIALELGYSENSTFFKMFKQFEGITPAEYRKK